DGNDGSTWALRKLTLNAVEDLPVAATDIVYVGPGVYRELLTCDVAGNAGNPITYIADVSGEHTDGVGGIVRITGSDNDQAPARGGCILIDTRNYRTFRGFAFDTVNDADELIKITTGTNAIIEDCVFDHAGFNTNTILIEGTATNLTLRRCLFLPNRYYHLKMTNGVVVDNAGHLIENCVFLGASGGTMRVERVGGWTIRNCMMLGGNNAVRVTHALTVGQAVTVENCIIQACIDGVRATVLGEILEDFNTFFGNGTDHTNVAVGGNSVTYPALFNTPILHAGASQISGFKFPWWFGELGAWSQVRAITGNAEPTEDLRGILRPVTASKNSWGPLQFADMERETGTVRTGSVSVCLHDAGRHQIWVPVANEETTISVYVYREANYAGNNPQMIVKQPGQADDVTTDAAAAGQWNELTTTLTPAAEPPYVVVELVSRNTNGAADEVFFDDLTVS
ncbi:MAG: right-handed parallel beta-helix repeat-containing protein, partial [Gammaproteobacteria bacterium]|nr:right-handed parallel beta-helix repeat-containing protein [Gammaproteobacteria bacterium]